MHTTCLPFSHRVYTSTSQGSYSTANEAALGSTMSEALTDILRQAEVLSELLDTPVDNIHLAQIAGDLMNWEDVAPFLEFSPVEEEEIRRDERTYKMQKRRALLRWKEKKGMNATYKELRKALRRAEEANTNPEIKRFREYLIETYQQAQHPSFAQPPTLEMAFYVELDLELLTKEPTRTQISLCNIFKSGVKGRQLILIEGPPGSGKTMLTCYITQQWVEGTMFQPFYLLIPISPSSLGNNCNLADIIPYPDPSMQKNVAKAITARKGKGVCFVIDSWDEVPHTASWRQSFLYQFVKGKVGYTLPECSIIVTSRPSASSMLRTCATSILQISEFDSLKIEEFVHKSLDEDNAIRFLEILEEKPELHALCHLPLNVTIAVHLYTTSDNELPSTRTELYKALVNTQLSRHWQSRTSDGDDAMEIEVSNVMELLPDEMATTFRALCKLAYVGLEEGRSSFDQVTIKKAGLDPTAQNTLSLMKAEKGFSKGTKYSFLHYTIQEFFAAYEITELEHVKQTEAVKRLLEKLPLSTTLPFYAGLTKMVNMDAFKLLLSVHDLPLEHHLVPLQLKSHPDDPGSDPRRLLVALMNCIYESGRHELYQEFQPKRTKVEGSSIVEVSFDGLHLTPVDCLSIGCFLRNTGIGIISPSLTLCNIKDTAFKMLMHQIISNETLEYNPEINLSFNANPITHNGIKFIKSGLGNRRLMLHINTCMHPLVQGTETCRINMRKCLKYLTECLNRSPGCIAVTLGWNEITTAHKYYLFLLMRFSKYIAGIYLIGNNLRGTMSLLGPALNYSNIVFFGISDCNLDDEDIFYLGKALRSNQSVQHLTIDRNNVSKQAIITFCVNIQHSAIRILDCDRSVIDTTEFCNMLLAINRKRMESNREPLVAHPPAYDTKILEYRRWHQTMSSLPPETVTGKEGVHYHPQRD